MKFAKSFASAVFAVSTALGAVSCAAGPVKLSADSGLDTAAGLTELEEYRLAAAATRYTAADKAHLLDLLQLDTPQARVNRWEVDARVALYGAATAEDKRIVKETLTFFNNNSNGAKFYFDDAAPSVYVHFIPRSEFGDYIKKPSGGSRPIESFYGICHGQLSGISNYRRARIVIDRDLALPIRAAVLRHELMHMLGFRHSRNPSSIMYPTIDRPKNFSEADRRAIRMLYGGGISSRMSRREVEQVLDRIGW